MQITIIFGNVFSPIFICPRISIKSFDSRNAFVLGRDRIIFKREMESIPAQNDDRNFVVLVSIL